MGKSFTVIALALLAAALPVPSPAWARPTPPAGAERTPPWNSENTELEADSRIVYGRLPNGLRYAIRHNDRPENQVLVRLACGHATALLARITARAADALALQPGQTVWAQVKSAALVE